MKEGASFLVKLQEEGPQSHEKYAQCFLIFCKKFKLFLLIFDISYISSDQGAPLTASQEIS